MGRKMPRRTHSNRVRTQQLPTKSAPPAIYDNDGLYIHDPDANQLGDPDIQAWMMGEEENETEPLDDETEKAVETEGSDNESEEDVVWYENQLGDPKVQKLLEGEDEEDDADTKRRVAETELMNCGEGSDSRKIDLSKVAEETERFIAWQRSLMVHPQATDRKKIDLRQVIKETESFIAKQRAHLS